MSNHAKHILKVRLEFTVIAVTLCLVAANPWRSFNQTLGIVKKQSAVDSSVNVVDSVYVIQGPALKIELPKQAVDTLTQTVVRRDSIQRILLDSVEQMDKQIAQLKAVLGRKQRDINKKQQQLLSTDRIQELLSKQNRKPDESRP